MCFFAPYPWREPFHAWLELQCGDLDVSLSCLTRPTWVDLITGCSPSFHNEAKRSTPKPPSNPPPRNPNFSQKHKKLTPKRPNHFQNHQNTPNHSQNHHKTSPKNHSRNHHQENQSKMPNQTSPKAHHTLNSEIVRRNLSRRHLSSVVSFVSTICGRGR